MTVFADSVLPAPDSPLMRMACRCSSIIMFEKACQETGPMVMHHCLHGPCDCAHDARPFCSFWLPGSHDPLPGSELTWHRFLWVVSIASCGSASLPRGHDVSNSARPFRACVSPRSEVVNTCMLQRRRPRGRRGGSEDGATGLGCLLGDGVHVGSELPLLHVPVLCHHAPPIQVAQPLVRVHLHTTNTAALNHHHHLTYHDLNRQQIPSTLCRNLSHGCLRSIGFPVQCDMCIERDEALADNAPVNNDENYSRETQSRQWSLQHTQQELVATGPTAMRILEL